MKPIVRLSFSFLACCFEFMSLGFFSFVPLSYIGAMLGLNFFLFLMIFYAFLLFCILISYIIVFIEEVTLLGKNYRRKD